jgi:hypothetical protein
MFDLDTCRYAQQEARCLHYSPYLTVNQTTSGIPTSIGGIFLTADATLASPEPSESSQARQLHALPTTRDDSIRVLLRVDLGTNQPGYAWFR